jgi:hypothetical protein
LRFEIYPSTSSGRAIFDLAILKILFVIHASDIQKDFANTHFVILAKCDIIIL